MTLGEDMFDGNVKENYYINRSYDPKNPIYFVKGFDVCGQGSKTETLTVSVIHLPAGRQVDVPLISRFNDSRASANEMDRLIAEMKTSHPTLLRLLSLG